MCCACSTAGRSNRPWSSTATSQSSCMDRVSLSDASSPDRNESTPSPGSVAAALRQRIWRRPATSTVIEISDLNQFLHQGVKGSRGGTVFGPIPADELALRPVRGQSLTQTPLEIRMVPARGEIPVPLNLIHHNARRRLMLDVPGSAGEDDVPDADRHSFQILCLALFALAVPRTAPCLTVPRGPELSGVPFTSWRSSRRQPKMTRQRRSCRCEHVHGMNSLVFKTMAVEPQSGVFATGPRAGRSMSERRRHLRD